MCKNKIMQLQADFVSSDYRKIRAKKEQRKKELGRSCLNWHDFLMDTILKQ